MSTPTSEAWLPSPRQWVRKGRDVVRYIPRGDSIPEESWRARHRNIVLILAAHVPFLFALGSYTGTEPYVTGATFTAVPEAHLFAGVGAIVALTLLSALPVLPRRIRTAVVSVGLMTSSAVLVYFSGGFIEAHFHFFVVVGIIAVYEDWLPFATGVGYVAVEHAAFGMSYPEVVYNHPDAVARPMGWALVHATFLLALSAALVANWFSIERSREETRAQIRNVRDSEEARAEVERLNERLLLRADELADAMDAVSAGDFTAEGPAETDIEAIAEIGDAFDGMRRELSSTVVDIRAFASTVEGTTRSVYEDAETLERTQRDQATDTREFATDIREQAETLESATDELTTLSATIEEIAANADQVSQEAGHAADAAEGGTQTAEEAVEAMGQIERSVDELAELVESLDRRMDGVAESTDLIEDVAEQTNMLALNANIEAARADEAGAGFAVVAEEVKTLADETRDHSSSIEETVARTVADVARVQEEMARTRACIGDGKATMADAGDAFAALSETVEGVDASVETVAAATDDGARSTEEVVGAIERVAERSRTIAERSESLADRAESGVATISEVRSRLDRLTEQTADLKRRLDAFTCETETGTGTESGIETRTGATRAGRTATPSGSP
ncbi:methyl-accepting chemotaxis protein [Halogeometricum luteum]|uniref:Methyl-accepting chemotaxis protein n=1 Tax=Halogeometricum luteum TaxID=2950537 RepID=A0ABU2FZ76_9EURY|nr:methyl-accepting chemotaxis protein [Halogeometricum sp. S3BR5-2]MDS0293830.1 methyl-accepting chemotaxis protein [Halogeometricum sp. S3BR5-2]